MPRTGSQKMSRTWGYNSLYPLDLNDQTVKSHIASGMHRTSPSVFAVVAVAPELVADVEVEAPGSRGTVSFT